MAKNKKSNEEDRSFEKSVGKSFGRLRQFKKKS